MDLAKWQNFNFLFWAYTFIWGLLAGYLFILAGRMRRLRRELDELRRERSDAGRL